MDWSLKKPPLFLVYFPGPFSPGPEPPYFQSKSLGWVRAIFAVTTQYDLFYSHDIGRLANLLPLQIRRFFGGGNRGK